MEQQQKDDKIRDQILIFLHKAYRNPKARLRKPGITTIFAEIRAIAECDRSDVERELVYLDMNGWIKKENERVPSQMLYKKRMPSYITNWFRLTKKGIDLFEIRGKYSKKDIEWNSNIFNVNLEGASINAPVTIGINNIVNSYNVSNDVGEIVKLINQKNEIDDASKEELKKYINSELPELLNNPSAEKGSEIIKKLKSIGQIWLIPIITQMTASYLLYQLGVPPDQIQIMRNAYLV